MTTGEGPLASSASDLYMEVASCFMSLDGVAGGSLGSAINSAATTLGGLVVDGDGNVYTSQTFSSLSSFESSGASRWTSSLARPVAGSLLLAEGGALLAVEAPLPSPYGPLSIEVFDTATGALHSTIPIGMGGRGDYMLTPAGQLVFTAYDYTGTNPRPCDRFPPWYDTRWERVVAHRAWRGGPAQRRGGSDGARPRNTVAPFAGIVPA